ncbi:MAG: FAD-dependent oxidoreductase [Kiritimatiellae bacterium]|nr:FAD-dependent oxidoreductase [Kiritimatiellia bacterium]
MGKSCLNILVLGAGPAGLSAAWNLVQDGHKVTVLEKADVWGGQSLTFEDGGYRFDLGPHNIHSRHRAVLDFLSANLKDEWLERKLRAEIYFRRKRVEYPLVGIQVLKFLPWGTSFMCGVSFAWRRLLSLFLPAFKDNGTYETWVVNRFGRRFYDIFFGPYTQKTWGVPPSELSDVIGKKRIAVHSIVELIKSVLFKKESHHPENPRYIRQCYAKHGVGKISDFFAEGIVKGGGEIITGAKVKSLSIEGAEVTKLVYEKDGIATSIDRHDSSEGAGSWEVISTIPLNELILSIESKIPREVREAASALDFTSEVFLFLQVDGENIFNVPLLYFSEDEFPFNRIYDIRLFSEHMVPKGKNAVCLELTCREGDERWNMPDKKIFEICIAPLEKYGLLDRSRVEGYVVRRLKHAYPIFRVGFQKRLNRIYDYLFTIENLESFGRQGMFAYANVDDVIWMGFEVAKSLPYQKRMRLHLEELLPIYINYLNTGD